jgi:FolB domain-containing protein
MDKVFIKDLRVQGILGIHDWERVTPREIIINVTLYTDTRRAVRTDDITDCVDYSAMSKKIRAHAESAARMTVEALANDLAELCLQEPKVRKVVVRVDKPGAVPDAASVGVEVERARPARARPERSRRVRKEAGKVRPRGENPKKV